MHKWPDLPLARFAPPSPTQFARDRFKPHENSMLINTEKVGEGGANRARGKSGDPGVADSYGTHYTISSYTVTRISFHQL